MTDKLVKYQRHLLGVAIFLVLSAVSITIIDGKITLNLGNYPRIMILIVLLSIGLVCILIQIKNKQLKDLSDEIKLVVTKEEAQDFGSLVKTLTSRQKTVYELILEGKSNKEIMEELYIEQSTLKSHINQIYKKLNIKSRQELKSMRL